MNLRFFLYKVSTKYEPSPNLSIRAWVLIQNFALSNPRTVKIHNDYQSPTGRLNSFQYHENWLQNLLISASLVDIESLPKKRYN